MKNLNKIIAYILLALLVFFIIRLLFNPIFIIKHIGNIWGEDVENLLAINKWLIAAISLLVGFATYYCYINIISRNKEKRKNALLVFILGGLVFYIFMYYQTKDYVYDIDGHPLQCCAINLQGKYELVPCDWKVHNMSGETVVNCTKRMLQQINNISEENINSLNYSDINSFFSKSGNPQVWYYERNDGKYELFNQSGTHPKLGFELQPINSKIATQINSYYERGKINKILYQNKVEKEIISVDNNSRQTTEIDREIKPKPYLNLNKSIKNVANRIDTSIIILDNQGNADNGFNEKISNKYFANETFHFGLFGRVNQNSFNKLLDGNFQTLNLNSHIDKLIVGKSNYSFRPSGTNSRNKSCDLNIKLYIYDTKTGTLLNSITKNGGGVGFTNLEAKTNAIDKTL